MKKDFFLSYCLLQLTCIYSMRSEIVAGVWQAQLQQQAGGEKGYKKVEIHSAAPRPYCASIFPHIITLGHK